MMNEKVDGGGNHMNQACVHNDTIDWATIMADRNTGRSCDF